LFLTDSGLETTLIFDEGWALPCFEAFTLLANPRGVAALRAYYDRHARLAVRQRMGFVAESPTWRANPEWGKRVGYDRDVLALANRAAIALMREVRRAHETAHTPIVISGNLGPRGDGDAVGAMMTPEAAEAYHAWQIGVLRDAGVDMVSAFTMTNVNEAIGVAKAARGAGLPCVISFTVETDGRLPTGDHLGDAIDAVDIATDDAPAYYMINCAHPTHFHPVLDDGAAWMARIGGVRANASSLSHAQLDSATRLHAGNAFELGEQYGALRRRFPHITVLGGCCGTDHRHVESIALACARQPRRLTA
jgi:S-methylmethionine-dependent homocysteine/selenocysteine methylase